MAMIDAEERASNPMREEFAGDFVSLLFPGPDTVQPGVEQPDCFIDLHLDQIVKAATAGRDEYELTAFYYQPLSDPDQVRYRQDVLNDLRTGPVREAVGAFAEAMRVMRRYRRVAHNSEYGLVAQRWFLEAAGVYREAAQKLGAALESVTPQSAGLAAVGRHLSRLLVSSEFEEFAKVSRVLHEDLGNLEYAITIKGAHVQVDAFGDAEELAPRVEETFRRFAQGEVRQYHWRFKDQIGLNRVEQQVLGCVARLFPEPFARLRTFCERYARVFDDGLMRFDREVQFYLGYLEFIEPLMAGGLKFCRVALHDGAEVFAEDGFDLSLAAKLASESRAPITNDFRLADPERVLVVTGPNQGGKTTFARMIGQIYFLAGLGLPVPAASAALALPDRVFTHFEREESLETLRGKFEDELVRIHGVLEQATERSVLVMNESFGSTTLADGLLVGSEIVRQIIDLGSVCVFVSFIDELATVGPQTVSMMSTVVPEDPSQRTFKIERKPADGLAYAAALATKYRLGYDDLRGRIAS
jgi:DNA mismatch repair protein MutS